MTNTSTDQAQARGVNDSAMGDTAAGAARSVGESLSALVDSQASELDVRRILKQADSDPEVRERWKRYHLVRALLQGDKSVDPAFDVSEQVSAAIAEDQQFNAAAGMGGRFRQWRNGLGKAAVAATVAFAFVAGVQQLRVMNSNPVAEPVAGGAEVDAGGSSLNSVPAGFNLPPFAARTVSTGSSGAADQSGPQLLHRYSSAAGDSQAPNHQAVQNHFDRLLLKHAEGSSTGGGMGLLPFARISRLDATEERDARE